MTGLTVAVKVCCDWLGRPVRCREARMTVGYMDKGYGFLGQMGTASNSYILGSAPLYAHISQFKNTL